MIDALCDLFGFKKEELVIIGNRIYTDIKTASVRGIKSALVYSVETTKQLYENSDVKADYEYESIFEIAKEF